MADTQLVRRDEQAARVKTMLTANRDRLMLATPKILGMDPARLLSVAFNAILYNPALLECTHASLLLGVREAMTMGLAIGGAMQQFFLVPFRNKGVMVATPMVGYRGYIVLVARAGATKDFQSHAVHTKDAAAFDYSYGSDPFIRHKPANGQPLLEADVHAAYAVAHMKTGGRHLEVLLKHEIDAHRARSRAKDGPWSNPHDYPAMARKTAIRVLAKELPQESELLSRALDIDDKVDRGALDLVLPGDYEVMDEGPAPPTTSGRLEALTAALKADRGEREPGDEDR